MTSLIIKTSLMCYSSVVKSAMLFFVFCAMSASVQADALHLTLKKAMAARKVTVGAISNGGYCDKSITLGLTNNTNQEIVVDVDPALIFRPEDDTSEQNLVLLGNETVVLAPCKSERVSLQTFCGKSYGHSPSVNHHYAYWKQGDSDLIRTLCYVKSQNVEIYLAQRAVWTFTNGYSLHTVYSSGDRKNSEAFAAWLAGIKHVPVPNFYMEYKLDSAIGSTHANVVRNAVVHVNMHWKNDGYDRHMYLVVLDANGNIYKRIDGGEVIDKDGSTMVVELDPKRDLKGRYTVKLYDDSHHIWDSKDVVVGMEPS